MRKYLLPGILLLLMLVAATAFAKGGGPRIAVLKFTEKSSGNWSGHVGTAAEDWFVDALVNTKKFSVLERQQLEALLREQNFQKGDDVSQATAVQAGKMAGVQFVVFGNIDFSQKKQEAHTGGGLGGLLGGIWGSAGKKTSEGNLTARVVNVQTGEIVFSKTEDVSTSNYSVSVMGTGAGTEWDETVAKKVFQPAVETITEEMTDKLSDFKESAGGAPPSEDCSVVSLKDGKVYLNKGKADGVKAGDKFDIYRVEIIKDPANGQELGRDETKLGTVVVDKIGGDHLAISLVEKGEGFQQGDVGKKIE
jgi:curli biogenesis system outer membrane secretion channel CsgG